MVDAVLSDLGCTLLEGLKRGGEQRMELSGGACLFEDGKHPLLSVFEKHRGVMLPEFHAADLHFPILEQPIVPG